MIKIRVKRYMTGEFEIRLSGHAGFGEPGKDIVCAGVSVLFFALAEVPGAEVREDTDGYVINVPPDANGCAVMTISGWKMIADKYPQCVRIG